MHQSQSNLVKPLFEHAPIQYMSGQTLTQLGHVQTHQAQIDQDHCGSSGPNLPTPLPLPPPPPFVASITPWSLYWLIQLSPHGQHTTSSLLSDSTIDPVQASYLPSPGQGESNHQGYPQIYFPASHCELDRPFHHLRLLFPNFGDLLNLLPIADLGWQAETLVHTQTACATITGSTSMISMLVSFLFIFVPPSPSANSA